MTPEDGTSWLRGWFSSEEVKKIHEVLKKDALKQPEVRNDVLNRIYEFTSTSVGMKLNLSHLLGLARTGSAENLPHALNALLTVNELGVEGRLDDKVLKSKSVEEAHAHIIDTVRDHCRSMGSMYRVDTSGEGMKITKYDSKKGFVEPDFSPRKHEGIATEFMKAHPQNKSVFYLHHSGGAYYHLLNNDMEYIGVMGFTDLDPSIDIRADYKNRKVGTMMGRLAIDHYEQTKHVTIHEWQALNKHSHMLAKRLGFKDKKKGAKQKRVVKKKYV